jgi:phosphoribosylformimino-5-aminoimidazole carboxamide ribotide isomerase
VDKVDIIPAIDLMNGQVVRLEQGDPAKATLYKALGSPAQVAERWKDEGARYLHVVDLDAAMELGNNRPQIHEIVRRVETPMEVGGGIRTVEDIHDILGLGVDRVILGTVAVERPEMLVNSLSEFGSNRIAVALDYLGDRIVVRGWKKDAGYSVENALSRFIELGVQTFLMTSVSRDGLLTGPDIETLNQCTKHKSISILAAGGVGSLEDLRRLKTTGVKGVVVGKALYEGRFKLKEALSLF